MDAGLDGKERVCVCVNEKIVWQHKAVIKLISTKRDPISGRFIVIDPFADLAVFTRGGKLVKEIKYDWTRGIHPVLFSGKYLVYAENIYNWTRPALDCLDWQWETRSFVLVDIDGNKRCDFEDYRIIGEPLDIIGDTLISIIPVNWRRAIAMDDEGDHSKSYRDYLFVKRSLLSGDTLFHRKRFSAKDGRSVLAAIMDSSDV